MTGDSGNDIFIANFGGDTIHAGSGNNIFEIGISPIPNEVITGFNSSHDLIDLTQLLNNVNTSAPGFNISNYVEYSASTGILSVDSIDANSGATANQANFKTVATLDTTAQTGQNAPHPTAPANILIAYQDNSHHAHSGHVG